MPRAPPLGSSRTNRKAAAKASAAMAAAFEGPESSDDEVFMSIDDHQKECAKERRESRVGLAACRSPLTLRPRRVHMQGSLRELTISLSGVEAAGEAAGASAAQAARDTPWLRSLRVGGLRW